MAVTVNIKKNLKGVTKRVNQMTKLGQYALANQVHADSNNYVPFLSGDLRNQSSVSSDNKQITWNVPYARRQYYNVGAKFTTPGTGPKWDKKAKSIHGKSWERITEKAMK